jgi:arylsulfatase A-like enzyme
MIVADGLGYGDLGCYGQAKIKTPNIDQLAAEGLRFTSFYAGAPSGPASRCALLTGLNSAHFESGSEVLLPGNTFTLAEVLRQSGYRTGLIGEWGLGDVDSGSIPSKKGFEEFVGYLTDSQAEDYYAERLSRVDPRNPSRSEVMLPENQGGKRGFYVPDRLMRAMVNFVRINKPDEVNHHRSFFLLVTPSIPRADTLEAQRSGNGMEVPSDSPYSQEPWPQPEKNKAAMLSRLDAGVGMLMEQLKKSEIEKDTIVIFSSSSGPRKQGGIDPGYFGSTGPLRGLAGELYEGGIRVPLIVHWPAKIKPGVNDTPWAMWDLLPTAADIALTKTPEKVDGISLLPTLAGQSQTNQHAFLYWELRGPDWQQAARMGDWKALRTKSKAPMEVYNLKTDLGEKQDVAEQNPKIVEKFEALLTTAKGAVEQKGPQVGEARNAAPLSSLEGKP